MKAKDTVMSKDEQKKIINQNRDMGSRHFYMAGERLCNKQAEISFKVGYEQALAELKE